MNKKPERYNPNTKERWLELLTETDRFFVKRVLPQLNGLLAILHTDIIPLYHAIKNSEDANVHTINFKSRQTIPLARKDLTKVKTDYKKAWETVNFETQAEIPPTIMKYLSQKEQVECLQELIERDNAQITAKYTLDPLPLHTNIRNLINSLLYLTDSNFKDA